MLSSVLLYSAQHILPNNCFEGALPGSVLSDGLEIDDFFSQFQQALANVPKHPNVLSSKGIRPPVFISN